MATGMRVSGLRMCCAKCKMIKKLLLYARTVCNMKPSQIYARVRKMFGLGCSLGVMPSARPEKICPFESVRELDFDECFLLRFPAEEFISGKITFMHESESFDWKREWHFPNRSALWNFNLHYFEFLMPMVRAYQNTRDNKYLQCIEQSISGWIDENKSNNGGTGWSPYTISIRLVYWFSTLFALKAVLDASFQEKMSASIYEQYGYLANHLEKDLLGNHYFENLKALVLCAIAFSDEQMLQKALGDFKKQLKVQILPDGMHYELSPMYHKIILEDLLRVAVALRSVNKQDNEIEGYLQGMLNVAYTFEAGLNRIPLFNDGGNNVAKSLEALLLAAKNHFGLTAKRKDYLPDSGYYFFRSGAWILIVDAGVPGAKENPGHAHCDAMSFELFHNGKPMLVNCGTYAYQCEDRAFFRSTAAHNTVMVNDTEQSECWGAFRMGRGSKTTVRRVDENGIQMSMTDQHGNTVERTVLLGNEKLVIADTSHNRQLRAWLHVNDFPSGRISASGENIICQNHSQWYAEDYGVRKRISAYEWMARSQMTINIDLSE